MIRRTQASRGGLRETPELLVGERIAKVGAGEHTVVAESGRVVGLLGATATATVAADDAGGAGSFHELGRE
ncbi:hypothetical protein [Streptomyces sp. NPDC004267]|uniref:hypothetical protein n=1 Tax=Streptomyces sp. NPDC004267 TaxID=3364694 RepID=UPI0036780051